MLRREPSDAKRPAIEREREREKRERAHRDEREEPLAPFENDAEHDGEPVVPETSEVEGLVVDDVSGVTMANVEVSLSDWTGSKKTVTDRDGRFAFTEVNVGVVRLRAESSRGGTSRVV